MVAQLSNIAQFCDDLAFVLAGAILCRDRPGLDIIVGAVVDCGRKRRRVGHSAAAGAASATRLDLRSALAIVGIPWLGGRGGSSRFPSARQLGLKAKK
jgi:hypothetical protein